MTHQDNWRSQAEGLLKSGESTKLEELLRRAVEDHPDDLDARLYLGQTLIHNGKLEECVPHLEHAVRLAPENPAPFIILGQAAFASEQWEDAAEFFLQALSLDPQLAEAHYYLGTIMRQLGQARDAATCYDSALALDPDRTEVHEALGSLLLEQGDPAKAAYHFREAMRLNPESSEAMGHLETLYLTADRYDALEELYVKGLEHTPDDTSLRLKAAAAGVLNGPQQASEQFLSLLDEYVPFGSDSGTLPALQLPSDALVVLGAACRMAAEALPAKRTAARGTLFWAEAIVARLLGDSQAQEAALRKVTEVRDFAPAWAELGNIALHRQELDVAQRRYGHALELDPNHVDSLNGMATVCARDNLPDTVRYLELALQQKPNHPRILANLGLAQLRIGSPQQAIPVLRQSVRLEPENAGSHINLALALLAQGKLEEGWREYEWRFATEDIATRPFDQPIWDGDDLAGQTILVHAEQGIGDEVLFASCIPDLIGHTHGTVIIECDPRLVPVFSRSFPDAHVVARRSYDAVPALNGLPAPDFQLPMGSLPQFLRPSLADFPTNRAYLFADPTRVDYWRARLAEEGPGPFIGFSWRSAIAGRERPNYPELPAWHTLFELNRDCIFVDLQYDDSQAERQTLEQIAGYRIFRPEFDLRNDLSELAALITALDLVITVGNFNAPFAAALGRPVWRLFSSRANDPLRLGADDYPWFPGMTLLEQRKPSDPQLLRLIGAWRRQFTTFYRESTPCRHAQELAAEGFMSQALTVLSDTPHNETCAQLELFLRDLVKPNTPLSDDLVAASGTFGAIVSAHRQGRHQLSQEPITNPDLLYYKLTTTPVSTAAFDELLSLEKTQIPISDGLAALPELMQNARLSGNTELMNTAAQFMLSHSPREPQTHDVLADASYVTGDLSAALYHERLFRQNNSIIKEWHGEGLSGITLLVDASDDRPWLHVSTLRWIAIYRTLEETGAKKIVVKVSRHLITLLQRSFPKLHFTTDLRNAAPGDDSVLWTDIETIAQHTGGCRTNLPTLRISPKWSAELTSVSSNPGDSAVAVYRRFSDSPIASLTSVLQTSSPVALDGKPGPFSVVTNPAGSDVFSILPSTNPDAWAAVVACHDLIITDFTFLAGLTAAVGTPCILVLPPQTPPPPRLFPNGGTERWFPNLAWASNAEQLQTLIAAFASASA